LEAGTLKVTDVLLGDEIFGGGLFPYLYDEIYTPAAGEFDLVQ
jgi:hypothetical protein